MVYYLQGLGVIIGIIGWVVIFNYGYYKLFKEKLWETENPLGALLMPFIFPLGVAVVMFAPYIIGKELFY